MEAQASIAAIKIETTAPHSIRARRCISGCERLVAIANGHQFEHLRFSCSSMHRS